MEAVPPAAGRSRATRLEAKRKRLYNPERRPCVCSTHKERHAERPALHLCGMCRICSRFYLASECCCAPGLQSGAPGCRSHAALSEPRVVMRVLREVVGFNPSSRVTALSRGRWNEDERPPDDAPLEQHSAPPPPWGQAGLILRVGRCP